MPAAEAVAGIVGAEHVLTDSDELEPYSHDGTFLTSSPDFVVRPASTDEVAKVVSLLYENNVPITARGSGTGLSGGAVATSGGAVISLERLDRLQVFADSLHAVAGAGVLTSHLQLEAIKHGLMYPPDPASVELCTIGGNVATNAGGPSCLKYGVTSEYVLGLEVVLGDGRVLRLGGLTRKRSSGYRLHQLFIGSEGTLGIVTEITVRLIPRPLHNSTALAAFSSSKDAAKAVMRILQSGYLPVACELIDRSSLAFVSDLLPASFPSDAQAVLLIETDGNDADAVVKEMEAICGVATTAGAYGIEVDREDGTDLWKARRAIGLRLIERRAFRLPEDIAVPIDQIPSMVEAIHKISKTFGVNVAIFGHAGDGNLHPSLLFDDRRPETLRRIGETALRIFRAAIDKGGTVSAEHGLGVIKKDFGALEIEAGALAIMRGIKSMLDPKGLLNPGKTLSVGAGVGPEFMEELPGWLEKE